MKLPLNRFSGSMITISLGAILVLMAACGGDGGDGNGDDPISVGTSLPAVTTTRGTSASNGDGVAGAFENQQFSVNQQFWHQGFRIEVGDGVLIADENALTREVRFFLSIDVTFENEGSRDSFLDSPLAVVTSGNSFVSSFSSDIPTVPGGLSSSGTFVFEVDEGFDLASAYLLVGAGDENRARVPLGAQGGELISLEPSQPPVSGSISMELIDLTFTSAELRADVVASHSELDEGKLGLTLDFDVVSRRNGNWNIFAQDFALILPNGNAVGPDGSDLASLPGSDDGVTTPGMYVRFLVDDPPAGAYTLRFTPGDWFVGEDGVTEVLLDFTLG